VFPFAPMDNTERLLTPKQLADIAGVSPATIKREVSRGRLRGIRVGQQGLVRVPESAWREYLQSAQSPSASQVQPTTGKSRHD
jgi:excisionase family DNA binding protein